MDSSLYKTLTVSRGLKYTYYTSPAERGQPTLLFLHGFPSTSYDWRHFVPFFKDRGYGLVVPDLLGHGATDKPIDPALYVSSAMSSDFVDILDAEGIETVIAVGHDWGCKAAARLASWHPERVTAYAFLAASYLAPRTDGFDVMLAELKAKTASDLYGYWSFFSEDDADEVIRSHIDSFVAVVYPHDPEIWKTRITPVGALKATLLEDFAGPLPPYLTKEDVEMWKSVFLRNGFAAPTCWYKVMTSGLQFEDDKLIPQERVYPPKTAPIFFGACLKDYVCLADVWREVVEGPGFEDHDVTIREFDADHWIVFSHANEVCLELEQWIEGFTPGMNA